MGCFLACFGSSKDKKRKTQKKKNKIIPRDQRCGTQKPLQPIVSSGEDISAKPTNLISEFPDRVVGEEQLSLSLKRKVTFDTNVKTYEPVSVLESTDFVPETDKDIEKQKEDNNSLGKSSSSHSVSEDDSITSSTGSYPPNHRYQNCRDSDDELEEFECEDSDLDDDNDEELEDFGGDFDEDEDNRIVSQPVWSESIPIVSAESSTEISLANQEVKTICFNQNARDRSVYVHPVLNPVENLSQWKAVKSKRTHTLKPHKENFIVEQESPFSSFSFKSKPKQSNNNQIQEIAVDASLSNWLVLSETTPTTKTSSIGIETVASKTSMSQGSNSVMSIEDRPILGALTVEELKLLSTSSSPRRSPSRSPDEMPIIGTVGTYWNHTGPAKGSGSASSYKGIPNTTSKYREVFVK